MKAIRFEHVGEPCEVLHTAEVDGPSAGPGEVLVRMLASPVNPSDLMFVRGVYGVRPELPAVPGFEGVGVVESAGPGLPGRLFVGKRVVVLNRSGGNWAEYAVVPSNRVIPISNKLSVQQAAVFFVNPATAWIMTQEILRIPRGAWLLQTAAASQVGRMVIRLGHHLGFNTLNIVRRESHADLLRRMGAQHVVLFEGDDAERLREVVFESTGHSRIRYAIDAVGGATGSSIVKCLDRRGHLLVYGTLDPAPLTFSPRDLMEVSARVEGFWLGNFMDHVRIPWKLSLVHRITRMVKSGILGTEVGQTFSLDEISDAVRAAEQTGRTGKTLLTFGQDTA